MSAPFAPRDDQVPSRLAHNAVGLSGVLFQSITHMAPGIAVAFSIIFTTFYAGGSSPLSVLLALIGCLAVAVCIGQLGKYLPSAGGLYTYSSNGLGPQVGFLVAWAYMLSEPVVPAFVFLVFGNLINSTATTYWHWPGWVWAPAVILIGLIVWYLVYEGIKLSTEAGVILGIFEIVVFVALAVTLIVDAGGRNTLSVFGPDTFNKNGMGSVIPGMIYAVLAFIGFEASAPLGEEAQNPRRAIPLAVIFSCLIIGVFYILCYYAATVYFGPSKMLGGFLTANNGDPWTGMAKSVWDWGWIIVFIALVNSSIANANAGANAATRAAYAMARIGLLPRQLAAIDPKRRTPYMAIHVQSIGAVILALILGWLVKGPLNGVGLLGAIATVLVIPIYLLTAISCFTYYWRFRRQEFNIILHFLVPLIAIVFFVPTEVASFGINFAGLGISPLSWPSYYAPWVVLVWVVLGVILLLYYMRTRPTRLRETADVYMEEIAAEDA
jgi:amino acid transporter